MSVEDLHITLVSGLNWRYILPFRSSNVATLEKKGFVPDGELFLGFRFSQIDD